MHQRLLFIILATLPFISCVNSKAVNSYAESGQKAFVSENIPAYGYSAYCYDSAWIYGSGRFLKNYDADSTHAIRGDTLIAKEYNLLAAYFNALARLSGSSESIHIDTLAGLLSAGTYGPYTVTSQEVEAATALGIAAKFLLTTGIRDKDVKNNLRTNWPAVQHTLENLALHHSNLQEKVANLRSNLELRSDTLTRSAATPAERWSVVYSCKEKYRELSAVLISYDKKQLLIQDLLKGYQALLDDDSNWRSKDFKTKITRLVADITYLYNSSKK